MSKPTLKRPLGFQESIAISLLNGVGMPVGCWDKRFRRDVLDEAQRTCRISDKAAAQLWRLFIRYRRQICHPTKATLMKVAEEKAAPDFRKQNAAANEQARIDELKRKYERLCANGS